MDEVSDWVDRSSPYCIITMFANCAEIYEVLKRIAKLIRFLQDYNQTYQKLDYIRVIRVKGKVARI